MSTYPATNNTEASDLFITTSNQIHDVVNGTANETVTVDSGDILSQKIHTDYYRTFITVKIKPTRNEWVLFI